MASAADRVLYLDASALVKLVVREPESSALAEEVRGAAIVSSEIALAEVPRAIRRVMSGRRSPERRELERALEALLEGIHYVPLDRRLLVRAGAFREAFLRTLDAIHLASAVTLVPGVTAFVSYDERQLEAAQVAALPLLTPR